MPERFEIRFDLDYLVEWICPTERPGPLSFRVSPATLLFENAGYPELTLKSPQGVFSIDEFVRSDYQRIPGAALGTWLYQLRGHDNCSVQLRASGFRLYLRSEPTLIHGQELSFSQRGGLSFAVPGDGEAP